MMFSFMWVLIGEIALAIGLIAFAIHTAGEEIDDHESGAIEGKWAGDE